MKTRNAKLPGMILLLSFAVIPALVFGQNSGDQAATPNRIVVPLSHPSQPAQIRLQMVRGSVDVHGYNGNQVIIESTGENGRETSVPDEARGMRRLTQSSLDAQEDNNVVTINAGVRPGNVSLQVPAGSALTLKTVNGSIQVQGVSGELDVESTNGAVTLDQVGGSIVAHTLNGSLVANVVRLDAQKPSSFTTFNGGIDLTLPAALHATLNMRSDQGDIYLDQGFDFKPVVGNSNSTTSESSGMTRINNTVRGAINGGGAEIQIRTFHGSILVHKGK